jgi:hypothetical protein
MAWTDYQSKAQIMDALRAMDPVAADSARYLADLMLEHQGNLSDREAVGAMAYSAMAKALRDSNLPGGPSNAAVLSLAADHGQQIGEVALAMAVFVAGKSRESWVLTAVAATVGIAIAALGA